MKPLLHVLPGAAVAAAILCLAATGRAQPSPRRPHIGYLYPAGGRRGETLRVVAGGQYLASVKGVYVSGQGVHGSIVRFMGRVRRLNARQRQELARRLKDLQEDPQGAGSHDRGDSVLPKHPLLNDLDSLSPEELEFVADEFLRGVNKRQPNAQIAEVAMIEIAIDADAAPGVRELRLDAPFGLTNPLRFEIGTLPEIGEKEPNDAAAPDGPPVELPVVFNGQVRPGDADRFRFLARRGQRLVIETHARRLIPFLADTVPGWFQATVALYDGRGKELAFDDDYRFDPDPVLFYEIPETGPYELEIRDALYRGREDFVYRIRVGEEPFITSIFPLGGRAGKATEAEIEGWNLPARRMVLDTARGGGPIRQAVLRAGDRISNPVAYAVDDLPESDEAEPNNTRSGARPIELPRIINGRIAAPGDVDLFRFEGRAGQEVTAEVSARRLGSPLDSLLRILDASGGVLQWNDDAERRDGVLFLEGGSTTHHADSRLQARLPRDGIYFVELSDAERHGGEAYGYRLRLDRPRPDFSLYVTTPTVNARAGTAVPLEVRAVRRGGFEGAIELRLQDPPRGFRLQGGRIPPGCDRIRVALSVPQRPLPGPVSLDLAGRAPISGEGAIRRRAVPCEERMQAFLYRHLVPIEELLVSVKGPRVRLPRLALTGKRPLRIPVGGAVEERFKAPKGWKAKGVRFELDQPPEGVAMREASVKPASLGIVLHADPRTAKAGWRGNLIVRAFIERARRTPEGKPTGPKRKIPLGILPPIPCEIVEAAPRHRTRSL